MNLRNTMKTSTLSLLVAGYAISTSALAGHTNNVTFTPFLNGAEEVSSSTAFSGDPDGHGEAYVFGIDNDPTTLCYLLLVENIQLVDVGDGMMAHIHEGKRGQNGPVVAALAGPEDGNAADCLTEGEPGKFPTNEAGIVQRILQNPENFYINVHNPEYPGGAIRGNLVNQLEFGDHHHHDDGGEMGPNEGFPSKPMNIRATIYSPMIVELFWDRSTDSDGVVVAYDIYRNGTLIDRHQGPSYYDDTLQAGMSYEYDVVAIDNQGNESAPSDPILVNTPQ